MPTLKNKLLVITFFTSTLTLWLGPPTDAQETFLSAFQIKWANSKTYLLKIARKMPAKHYDYKPVDRQMSFKEQLLHIRENMLWLSNRYVAGDTTYQADNIKAGKTGKKATIPLLASAFEAVDSIVGRLKQKDLKTKVNFFAGPKTKLQILNLLQDHVTHHRGQLIVYLNLKGIKPPDYVGW